jgi:hypothetical protein
MCGHRRAVGKPEPTPPVTRFAAGPRPASTPHVLQRCVRARMESPQQSVVRASADQETRQGDLSDLRVQRRQGSSRMDAIETSSRRSRRAASLAGRAPALGGRPHSPGGGWRRRVWIGELSFAVSPLSRHGNADVAGRRQAPFDCPEGLARGPGAGAPFVPSLVPERPLDCMLAAVPTFTPKFV